MNEELKPIKCGCGGEAFSHFIPLMGNLPSCFIYCKKCGIKTIPFQTESEAITAWNKAMGAKDINVPDKETVLIEPFDANLTHVGYCMCGELVNIDYSYCPRCGRKIEWRRITL